MSEISSARVTLCEFFDEDVVIKTSHSNGRQLQFGLVVESSENASSDDESGHTSDGDTDTDGETDADSRQNRTKHKHKWRKIRQGFAKIALYPSGNTQLIHENKMLLYDRSLLAGDVVQRIDANTNKLLKSGEHGFCKDAKIFTTLKVLGTDRVIANVDSCELQMLSAISVDTVCILDAWLGYVKDIHYLITLKCSDSSMAIVTDDQIEDFYDLFAERDDNSEFSKDEFYIGQQLYGPKRRLKNANWIVKTNQMKSFLNCNSRRLSKIKVAVEDICIESVSINWICCLSDESVIKHKCLNVSADQTNTFHNNNLKNWSSKAGGLTISSLHPPNEVVSGDAIKRIRCLNYFAHCSLQIGHQCYYTIKSGDQITSYSQWNFNEANRFYENKKYLSQSVLSSIDNICEDNINDYDISCDSLSNCSICTSGMEGSNCDCPSLSSMASNSKTKKMRKTFRFLLPIKQVKKKKLRASKKKIPYIMPIEVNVGYRFPVEIVATKTRVSVVWQNGDIETDLPSNQLYPVHHIDDHDFYPGDFVVENKDYSHALRYGVIQKSDFASRVASVKWFDAPISSSDFPIFVAQEDISVYDIKDHPDFSFRPSCCVVRMPNDEHDGSDYQSRAGQVVDITLDGMLLCVWANGSTSHVFPYQLFVIGEYDSDDLWDDSDDDYDDYSLNSVSENESWETESESAMNESSNNKKKKKKKSSAAKRNLKTSYKANFNELVNLLYSGATQLEEWLKNGSGNYLKNIAVFQKAIQVFKNEANGMDVTADDRQQSKKMSNINAKIQNISQKVMQLMSFSNVGSSEVNKLKHDINFSLKLNGADKYIETNLDNSYNESKEDGLLPSSSSTNISTFLELLHNFKQELTETQKEENPEFKPETSDKNTNIKTYGHKENENIFDLSDETDSEVFMDCVEEFDELPKEESIVNDSKANDIALGQVLYLDCVPDCHKFVGSTHQPKNAREFAKRVKQEITLLQTSLPEGIVVALFHDRMDLYSIMISGPKCTPYEDGLFVFDVHLPSSYPNVPPLVHYHSYCSDRINPNLYENGKVCISLLGTWSGKGTEVWASSTSNLLQVIVSIQGLILVAEPYYNEAGYMKQRGTTLANENSRLYNEMAALKLIQSMTKLFLSPYQTFDQLIRSHIKSNADKMIKRLEHWIYISELCASKNVSTIDDLNSLNEFADLILPQFPLLPASYGFCLTMKKAIQLFKEALQSVI